MQEITFLASSDYVCPFLENMSVHVDEFLMPQNRNQNQALNPKNLNQVGADYSAVNIVCSVVFSIIDITRLSSKR